MEIGTAFLRPSGTTTNPDKKHAYVVCCAPNEDGEVVLVTITSWQNDLCDGTCVMDAGCHPFIRHKSYIMFRKCIVETVDAIQRGLDRNNFIPLEPFPADLVESFRQGILASPHTPKKIKKHFRQNGG